MATASRDDGSCSVDEKSSSKTTGKRKGSAIPRDLTNPSGASQKAPPKQLAAGVRGHSRARRKAPRVQLACGVRALCDKDTSRMCARAALSYMNKKTRSTKHPKYELVEALDCIDFFRAWMYHCNFIVRPKDDAEAEHKLVFAEVMREVKRTAKSKRVVTSCRTYCILGPSDLKKTETGPSGCKTCDRLPGCVVHPEDGFTSDDKPEWATWLRNPVKPPALDGKAECA